jgi:hypothetical protein
MDMTKMTASELIAVHNERCAKSDRITAWKASKAALIKKIDSFGDATPKASAPKAAEKSGAAPKATIGDSVRRLLLDGSLTYAQIVDLVRAAHPEAATTARSVASVACAMRKDGTDVPTRPAAKGAA